nr:hypothetical protein [Stenotrophomonas maltophilia]
MKTLLFPFVAALALAACSPSKIEFQIDNPTDTPLALSIDGQDLPVAAHGSPLASIACIPTRSATCASSSTSTVVAA